MGTPATSGSPHHVRSIVALGFFGGLLLSYPLWLTSGRTVPLIPPAFLGIPALPVPFDWVRLAALFGLLLTTAVSPRRRWPVAGVLVLVFSLALEDRMRWQPWAYQYTLALVPFLFLRRPLSETGVAAVTRIQRWVLIATYLWGGFHKIGVAFPRMFQGTIAKPLYDAAGGGIGETLLTAVAHFAGPVEIAIGALLCFRTTRKAGALSACLLHATILVWFIIQGRNSVIWPWNATMIGLVIALFLRPQPPRPAPLQKLSKPLRVTTIATAVLVFLMPAFSRVGTWPKYLSFHLYSGHAQRLLITMASPDVAKKIPEELAGHVIAPPDRRPFREIDTYRWVMDEFNVAIVSDEDVLLGLCKWFVSATDLGDEDVFFYRDFPMMLPERGWDRYSPSEIERMDRFPPLRQKTANPAAL